MRGHRLKGENFSGRYVIADVQMDHDYPTIRRALFDPQSLPGMTVLIHKQPDDIWRIDFQLGWNIDRAKELQEDNIRARVDAMLGPDVSYELE